MRKGTLRKICDCQTGNGHLGDRTQCMLCERNVRKQCVLDMWKLPLGLEGVGERRARIQTSFPPT